MLPAPSPPPLLIEERPQPKFHLRPAHLAWASATFMIVSGGQRVHVAGCSCDGDCAGR